MNAQPVDVGLRSRSRLDGLLFGFLSGLAFALVTWGSDAVSLARVASYCPWFKFVVGTVFCLIVGGAVGWVVAALDRSLVGLVGWALAGLAFGWLAAYLPFQGFNRLIGWLNPRFRGDRHLPRGRTRSCPIDREQCPGGGDHRPRWSARDHGAGPRPVLGFARSRGASPWQAASPS